MGKVDHRESVVLENQGQKIFGILHRPLTPGKHPVVIMCHGLAGHKTGKFRLYVLLSEKLAELGIASLRIDFRGSGDSEGDFSDMTLDSEISDTLKGLEFLKTISDLDLSRIGLFGRSFGGIVALMAAHRAGNIKSIVTWAPLYDGHQWIDQWNSLHGPGVSDEHRSAMMRVNGQVPGYAFFQQLFSVRMEEELQALDAVPMLHIHGDKDAVVSVDHANLFVKGRENAKGQNKFIRLPHSDHDFSHIQEQQIALKETCLWFNQTL